MKTRVRGSDDGRMPHKGHQRVLEQLKRKRQQFEEAAEAELSAGVEELDSGSSDSAMEETEGESDVSHSDTDDNVSSSSDGSMPGEGDNDDSDHHGESVDVDEENGLLAFPDFSAETQDREQGTAKSLNTMGLPRWILHP
ncbi:hypothetical protein EV182_001338, partial [Spiromyces aspiralis]